MAGQDSRGDFDYFLPPDDLNEIFCVTWKAFRVALYLVLWTEFDSGGDCVTALENENQ